MAPPLALSGFDGGQELGDAFGESGALLNLGDLANALGDVETARQRVEEARRVARAVIEVGWSAQEIGVYTPKPAHLP